MTPLSPRATATRVDTDPVERRYHVALWLAELVLRGNAVDQTPGDVRVERIPRRHGQGLRGLPHRGAHRGVRRHGGWYAAQDRHHLDVDDRDPIGRTSSGTADGDPAAVIDAKYKAEKPAGFPDADLYQMLAYCTALGSRWPPRLPQGNDEKRHTVRHAGIRSTRTPLTCPPSPATSWRRLTISRTASAGTAAGSALDPVADAVR